MINALIKEDQKILRVALYVRVSTLEQAEEGYSIKAQIDKLTAYAKAKDYTIVDIYKDPGESGAKLDRPDLQRLIADVKAGRLDVVVVYKLDRLSRSQKHTLYLIEDVFIPNNVHFVSINESFDTSTPLGRAMIGILSVFAQLEREQIKERTSMGREERAKEGLFHGGGNNKTPLGYDYVDGKLIINPYEAMIIKEICHLYVDGKGIPVIFDYLVERYPHSRFSGTMATIPKILDKDIYRGIITWKGKTYNGQHQAIISEELHEKIKSLRQTRSKNPRSEYLLSGFLYCSHCGARIYPHKTTEKYTYYKCYSQQPLKHMIKDPNCDMRTIRKDILDGYVINEIKNLKSTDVMIKKKKSVRDTHNELIIRKRVKDIDKQVGNLIDLYQLGSISFENINERVKKLNEEKQALLKQLSVNEDNENNIPIEEIKDTIEQLPNFDWESSTMEDKRNIIGKLIDHITIFKDKIVIKWRFSS